MRLSELDLTPRRARLLLVLAALLWSLAGVFIKFLSLPSLTIVFYRSFFASFFFLFLLRKTHDVPRGALIVSIATYTAAISSFVAANQLTTAANAIVLQYTAPMFVFLMTRLFFREEIPAINWLALAIGMVGIGVIFFGSAGQPDAGGVLVALLSGLLFSAYMVNLRFVQSLDPGILTFANNLGCCLILLPLVKSQLALSLEQALIVAVMGVVQLGIPYWLFSKGLEKIPLQEASLIVLIEPVLNPVWVALAVDEVPSLATLMGGGLILLGLGLRYMWSLAFATREAQRLEARD